MSATLESEKVSTLLDNAPVIISQGRCFPVDIRYVGRRSNLNLSENTAAVVQEAYRNESGSMLVFLPGEADIRNCANILQQNITDPNCRVIPLYGRLDNSLQRMAIETPPAGVRKIVLATAIAESSLTIDGVRIIVDSGFTRIARYQASSNMEHLETVPISQDASVQRAGRAGRTEPGVAYRLWNEFEESRRVAVRPSQMSYCDLSGMVLELAVWGVSNIEELKFMEAPSPSALAATRKYLQSINALDANNSVTAHGKLIHDSSLSVRAGHLLAVAAELGEGNTGIQLAALLDGVDSRKLYSEDVNVLLKDLPFDKRLHTAKALSGELNRRMKKYIQLQDNKKFSVGQILAAAFPERVGRRRGTLGELRYLLAGGRAAVWPDMVNLARSEFIVALDLDERPGDAGLHLACAVEAWELEEVLLDKFSTRIELKITPETLAVEALELRKLGAITWSSKRAESPDRGLLCAALSEAIKKHGIETLDLPPALERLFGQIALIKKYDPESDLPELSPQYILDNIEDILYQVLPEKFSKNMLKNIDWASTVYNLLDYNQQRRLKNLLPEKIKLENGREFKVDYTTDPPSLAGKLQWFFGVRRQPALLNGKLPLTIVLQSPAGRPVQTTSDIGNFWQGSYKLVRNDLRGRYPKHDWPENP